MIRSRSRSRSRIAVAGAVVLLAIAACGTTEDQATVESESTTAQTTARTMTTDQPPPCTSSDEPNTDNSGASSTTPAGTSTTVASTTSSAATSTAVTEPTTDSTEPPTTSATVPIDSDLQARQAELSGLGYWLGQADGVAGPNTAHAVTAFQKAEGLDRTGRFDDATVDRLAEAGRPSPRSDTGSLLEVDLERQILLVVRGGQVDWVFDIATGASSTPTPAGSFEIYREIDGFRHAPLGTLYRPKYFNGGIAFHGYTSVPAQPASHGCVRLTYAAIDHVWDAGLAPVGTTVVVY